MDLILQAVYSQPVRRLAVAIMVLGIFFIITTQIWIELLTLPPFDTSIDNKTIILWWTPFTGAGDGVIRACGKRRCYITDNRKFLHHQNLKVIMFYGSDFDYGDLPVPRRSNHLWALMHEESPRNVPPFMHEPFLSLFNISATFSRKSHFPLPTMHLDSIGLLTSTKYFVSTSVKNELLKDIAPVLYIQSDCDTPCDRDSYVVELMKYIKVDSYGRCLHNKELPLKIRSATQSIRTDEFHDFVSKYKFTISIENSICHDYVTEKLWRPLIVGSVPIYMGSPSVRDWLPYNNSAILISDFSSPKFLAEYLHSLNNNDTLYNQHLKHKINGYIENEFLLKNMRTRNWNIGDEYDEGINFVEAFECYVCKLVQRFDFKDHEWRMDKGHYDCLPAYSILTNAKNVTNNWSSIWRVGICEGKILADAIANNINFTSTDVMNNMTNLIGNGC